MTKIFSKTSMISFAAAAALSGAVMTSSTTSAQAGWHGGWGAPVAAGVVGGLALGALASSAYRPYYAAPVYYGPACYTVRERVWTAYGWRFVRTRVCD